MTQSGENQVQRLRLLKVIVQAVVVIDDGETLVERVVEPVSVSADEWEGFAAGRFAESFELLRKQVES